MITLEQYWMGRDVKYRRDLTEDIIQNAQITVDRANELLLAFHDALGIEIDTVASGWRPPLINEVTSNAAKASTHLTAEAVDLRDTENRDLARWCVRNTKRMESAGLWMESPEHPWRAADHGKPWVHWQIRPPRSGKRIYIASAAPATAPLLLEQGGVA
jgi:hypothetical protein